MKLSIADWLLSRTITFDLMLSLGIFMGLAFTPLFDILLPNKPRLIHLLETLSNTYISLSGFILAALTIIVTFRASALIKSHELNKAPIDLILAGAHYQKIVAVFSRTLSVLLIMGGALYTIFIYSYYISEIYIFSSLISALFVGVIVTFLSLYVLLQIVRLT